MPTDVMYPLAGLLKRYGRVSETAGSGGTPVDGEVPSNTRGSLVYGNYQPSAATTGVIPGTVLTPYNSSDTDTLTLPDGVTITSKIIYGDVKPAVGGTPTNLINCLLVGGNHVPGSQSAVVDCNAKRNGTGKLVLTDCTIAPRHPSLNRDCIVGHRYELYRCDLSGGIDGIGIFITTNNGTACQVVVQGTYVHDLTYFYPDYANGVSGTALHTDGSHNDCCQIQGGTDIWLKGNYLHGSGSPSPGTGTNPQKPWLAAQGYNNGQCLIVQNNVGTAPDQTVIIEDNWMWGSAQQLAAHDTAPSFIYRRNKHYRATAQTSPGWAGYWVRVYQRAGSNVTGLTVGGQTNSWVDGPYAGQLLAEPRDAGIDYIK